MDNHSAQRERDILLKRLSTMFDFFFSKILTRALMSSIIYLL